MHIYNALACWRLQANSRKKSSRRRYLCENPSHTLTDIQIQRQIHAIHKPPIPRNPCEADDTCCVSIAVHILLSSRNILVIEIPGEDPFIEDPHSKKVVSSFQNGCVFVCSIIMWITILFFEIVRFIVLLAVFG